VVVVLIVEDNVEIRDELVAAFEARGFGVTIARDGAEAFQEARAGKRRPDVILLDLMLPGMDGTEFLEHQDEEPMLQGVPVIVITAWAGQLRFLTPTVRAVVEKPFPLSKVVQLVHDISAPG
jgi:CheY-like chemotaxis protein